MDQPEATIGVAALGGIARLEVWAQGKPARWGTAFLITPRHAISAYHVIVPRNAAAEARDAESLRLIFASGPAAGEGDAVPVERSVHPVPEASDSRLDWVLLELDADQPDVAGVTPPILRGLRTQERVPFRSFGYSSLNPRKGLMLFGHVELSGVQTGDESGIQLFSVQAAAPNAYLRGQSGAPVYSGGVVIGVVRSFLERGGAAVGGTLFACDIEDVLRHPLVASLARRDPCVGLPALSPTLPVPSDPFRYLKPYLAKDARLFFGRCRDIGALARLFDGAFPITLLYGPTGVGKSSLLQAGIEARFSKRFDVRVRRRSALRGLAADLADALVIPGDSPVEFERAWRGLEASRNGGEGSATGPILVLLDQIEEAWTLPLGGGSSDPARAGRDEMDELCRRLQFHFADSDSPPRTRVVLSFRKEWLTEVDTALRRWGLPAGAHALAPIDAAAIEEIVSGIPGDPVLAEAYRLQVQPDVARLMAQDISADSSSAKAPILQIILTNMWHAARERDLAAPRFDVDLYRTCRKPGTAIAEFIDDRLAKLPEVHRPAIETGAVLELLYFHTTEAEGTGGVAASRSDGELSEAFGNRAPQMIALAEALAKVDLLHHAAAAAAAAPLSVRRLAHDVMAPPIRHRYEQSQLPGPRATRILKNAKVDWADDRRGSTLNAADLKIVERGLDARRVLDVPEQRLLKASRDVVARSRLSKIMLKVGAVAVAGIIAAAVYFGASSVRSTEQRRVISILSEARVIRPTERSLSLQLVKEAMNVNERAGLPMDMALESSLREALAEMGGYSLGNLGDEGQSASLSDGGEWVAVWGRTDADECLPIRMWHDAGKRYEKVAEFPRTDTCDEPTLSGDGRWLVTRHTFRATLWRRDGDGASAQWKTTVLPPIVGDAVFSRDSQWLYVVPRRRPDFATEGFDIYRLGHEDAPVLVGHHAPKFDGWGMSRTGRLAYTLDSKSGTLTLFSLPLFHAITTLNIGKEKISHVAVADSGLRLVVLHRSSYQFWSRDSVTSTFRKISSGGYRLSPEVFETSWLRAEIGPDERWVAVTGSRQAIGPAVLILLDPKRPLDLIDVGSLNASATYSDDGHWLVLASNTAVKLVDLRRSELTGRLESRQLEGATSPATFTPEGILITGSSEPGLSFWNRGLLSSEWLRATNLKGHEQNIEDFATDTSRSTLVSWDIDGEARVTRLVGVQGVVEPRLVHLRERSPNQWPRALDAVAEASAEDIERTIDGTSRSIVDADAENAYSAQRAGVASVIGQSPDRLWSLVARQQAQVKTTAWLVQGHPGSRPRRTCSGKKFRVEFALQANEAWVFCESEGRQDIRIYDLRDPALASEARPRISEGITLDSLKFSQDGRWVAARAYDAGYKSQVLLFDHARSHWWEKPIETGVRDYEAAVGVYFDPKSRWLLINAYTSPELWHLTSESVRVVALARETGSFAAATFSPDGKWLAYAAYRVTPTETVLEMRVVELPDQPRASRFQQERLIFSRRVESKASIDLSFSDSSRWLLVTTPGAQAYERDAFVSAQLFDRESNWAQIDLPPFSRDPEDETGNGWVYEFGARDRWLALGRGRGSEVAVLDLRNPSRWVQLDAKALLGDIAISPDGEMLASIGLDVRLWRLSPLPRDRRGVRLPFHEVIESVASLPPFGSDIAFSRDAKRLVFRDSDGRALIWRTDPKELDVVAASTVSRNMTQGEWERYFPGEAYRRTFPEFPDPTDKRPRALP